MPKALVLKGSGTSCDVIVSGVFFSHSLVKKISSRDGCFLLSIGLKQTAFWAPATQTFTCLAMSSQRGSVPESRGQGVDGLSVCKGVVSNAQETESDDSKPIAESFRSVNICLEWYSKTKNSLYKFGVSMISSFYGTAIFL